jgi:hypothetical protein
MDDPLAGVDATSSDAPFVAFFRHSPACPRLRRVASALRSSRVTRACERPRRRATAVRVAPLCPCSPARRTITRASVVPRSERHRLTGLTRRRIARDDGSRARFVRLPTAESPEDGLGTGVGEVPAPGVGIGRAGIVATGDGVRAGTGVLGAERVGLGTGTLPCPVSTLSPPSCAAARGGAYATRSQAVNTTPRPTTTLPRHCDRRPTAPPDPDCAAASARGRCGRDACCAGTATTRA